MSENLYSNFIGAKAENIEMLKEFILQILDHQKEWRKSFYVYDKSLYDEKNFTNEKIQNELDKFLIRAEKNLPYFHPRYSAQMLKDPAIPTILGYLTFMLSNPNNHAYEGGPVTTEMEMEVTELMLKMTGLKTGWGHLASGGSLANLEALWACRDFYKDGTVYFSSVSHYSWKRICKILNIPNYKEINIDKFFRIDLNHLEDELKKNKALMVMANLGSTGAGSVDDIESILKLKEKYEFHLHIDAAYGGFVRSIILDNDYNEINFSNDLFVSEFVYSQLKALKDADSITIDPHKQGLISYGAGAVLYKNEELRQVMLNTAPYTYHKLDKPNIGMFSLEGSRPGAMAAACYLTYQVIPPNKNGLGEIISSSLASAKKFYELISQSEKYLNLYSPDLDINCFYLKNYSDVKTHNEAIIKIYNQLSVEAAEPEFILSKFVISPEQTERVLPNLKNEERENFIALRTVFMKHWGSLDDFYYVNKLFETLSDVITD